MEKVFAERLTSLLNTKNMTQKELATNANVTEAAMSYYTRGDRIPRQDVLVRICEALGCSSDYLLGRTDNVAPATELTYIQRGLQKLDAEQLKRAEKLLAAAFDDIFNEEE